MLVQISSGQGPEECQIAVGKLFRSLAHEYKDIEEVSGRKGRIDGSYHSVMFVTDADLSGLEGTVQWICESRIRPHHKRKNWFVDISVIPEREDVAADGEVRMERFHCGGKGGQNVNKVETGVRLIHVPTGTVVTCSEERSQFLNTQKALKMLNGILLARKLEADAKQTNQAWREHTKIIRGNPVRVYEGDDFKRIR